MVFRGAESMTPVDKQVLANVVIDPDAWYDHVLKTFGEQRANAMLAAKVERHYADYVRESEKPDYQNRAMREESEKQMTR